MIEGLKSWKEKVLWKGKLRPCSYYYVLMTWWPIRFWYIWILRPPHYPYYHVFARRISSEIGQKISWSYCSFSAFISELMLCFIVEYFRSAKIFFKNYTWLNKTTQKVVKETFTFTFKCESLRGNFFIKTKTSKSPVAFSLTCTLLWPERWPPEPPSWSLLSFQEFLRI